MPVQNNIPGQKINPEKLERARELRGGKLGVHFRNDEVEKELAGVLVRIRELI